MKISIAIHIWPKTANGGTKIIFEYANYLVKNGHDVSFYITNKDVYLQKYRIPTKIKEYSQKYIVEKKKLSWFTLHPKIKRIAVDSFNDESISNADIIIATALETARPVAALSPNKGDKFYFIQDFENWHATDNEVEATYRLGMKNIVVSKWLEKIVNKHSKNVFLISNSIDTSMFNVKVPIEERDCHSIVFHYRSQAHKGCQYAIDAIKILLKKYMDLKVYVVSNEKRPDILPKEFRYFHNISAEEVAKVNNKATIFLCTSIEEGFGLPGLEGMACGCVLVSTKYKGVLEYAVDGENALLSPVKDVNAIVHNVERLFGDYPLLLELSRNAVDTANKRSFINAANRFEKYLCGDKL